MKKKITIILLSSVILFSLKTMAQKETETFSFGFGLEPGIPTGELSDVYSFSFGLTIRGSYHVGPGFVTLTTGGVGYAPKTAAGVPKNAAIEIPVRAGYKYIFQHHFFVMGELGYASFKSYFDENGNVESTSSGSFIGAPTVGVQFNSLELGLRYGINFTHNNGGDLALRIGFNF